MALAETTELAYERAFQTHWSDVFRFALAWTNDWAAAEDLAQEAFLRLWDHRGQARLGPPGPAVAARRDTTTGHRSVPGAPAPAVAVADGSAADDHRPGGPGALARCLRRAGRPVATGTQPPSS